LSSISAPSILRAADREPARRARFGSRRERVLAIALLLSLALHLAGGSGAIDWLSSLYRYEEPEASPPLRTVLKPPPPPVVQEEVRPSPPPPPKRKPRPHVMPPRPAVAPVEESPVVADSAITSPETQPAPVAEAPKEAPKPAAEPAPAEAAAAPAEEPLPPPPEIPVPKRLDMVGTLTVGPSEIDIGTGGFSLRHDGNRYEISVLGRTRGLARILMLGEYNGISRGAITADGLQPSEYIEERGSADRRESAVLDWESGVIRLKDGKIAPLEAPTHDRLSVIMQFYYKPPTGRELTTRVTGTRYVDSYTFKRHDDEAIEVPMGIVTAQMWRVDYEDGSPRIELWMSPDYHYLPMRLRIHARKENGGRFATLSINELKVED